MLLLEGLAQCLACCRGSCSEFAVLLWGTPLVSHPALHLSSGGHMSKKVPNGLLSDVSCPGDFCNTETGIYFRKDLIWGQINC